LSVPISEGSSARNGPAALFFVSLHCLRLQGGKLLTHCPGEEAFRSEWVQPRKWLHGLLHGALQLCLNHGLEESRSTAGLWS